MWLDEQHRGLVIWIAGLAGSGKSTIGRILVERIREEGAPVVYLDGDEFRDLLGHYSYDKAGRIDVAKKRIEFAHFLSMQGIVTVVTTISLFDEVYWALKQRIPHLFTVFLDVSSIRVLCKSSSPMWLVLILCLIHQVLIAQFVTMKAMCAKMPCVFLRTSPKGKNEQSLDTRLFY